VDLLEFPGSKTNSNILIYKIIPLRIRFYVLTNGIFPEPIIFDLGDGIETSNPTEGRGSGFLGYKDILSVYHNTVDGQNPAPPRMMIIPLFIGF